MRFNKTILKAGALLGVGITSLTEANAQKAPQKQPNILYVFADQMRADALGYTGNAKAYTPNIDRFAKEALDFSNAVSSTPVSAAHRASLLTGKYQSSTGMVINELNMNLNHRFLGHCLGDAGYDLGYVGKMHLNDRYFRPYEPGPQRFGFDGYWAAYSFNHRSYHAKYHTDIDGEVNKVVELTGVYSPKVFTDLCMDYIRTASQNDKPFAVFLSWNPPHDPWTEENTDPKWYKHFKDVNFQLPENFKSQPDPYMDRYPNSCFEKSDGEKKWRKDFLNSKYAEYLRCYYAMNSSIDEQFGRLLDLLDELGLTDNTIVIFTCDHGEMFTSQGRMYKLTFYDEAARVPFIVRAPGGLRGRSTDVLLNTPDIMPTILGLAGRSDLIPEEVEGLDLSHVIYGKKGNEPEFAFMQGMGHTAKWLDGFEWRAVRDKRYTYAKYLRDGLEILLDRKEDPHCLQNFIDDPKYGKVADELRKKMYGKMAELNDQFMPCTWYRDNWMYKSFSIRASARGEFGPLPPVEPRRK